MRQRLSSLQLRNWELELHPTNRRALRKYCSTTGCRWDSANKVLHAWLTTPLASPTLSAIYMAETISRWEEGFRRTRTIRYLILSLTANLISTGPLPGTR